MDPNENLREQLMLAQKIGDGTYLNLLDDAERLAELVLALDQWIKGGGFLPEAWRK